MNILSYIIIIELFLISILVITYLIWGNKIKDYANNLLNQFKIKLLSYSYINKYVNSKYNKAMREGWNYPLMHPKIKKFHESKIGRIFRVLGSFSLVAFLLIRENYLVLPNIFKILIYSLFILWAIYSLIMALMVIYYLIKALYNKDFLHKN